MAEEASELTPLGESPARSSAVWEAVTASLRSRAQAVGRPLRILDFGGGAGGLAVPLARRGYEITVVDPSPNALASLTQRAQEVGGLENITAFQGDVDSLSQIVPAAGVDAVLCHGVLEHVDAPADAVAELARVLTHGGVLSLTVAQRVGAVMSRALSGRFEQARQVLLSEDGRWGEKDPLRRRFDAAEIAELLAGSGLEIVDAEGVRVFEGLVPASLVSSDAERESLRALERAVAGHPASAHLAHIGASLHVLASKAAIDSGQ
ncbi:putative S-adenosyl-L-methionine-dependent methyltransferase [Dermatophilus congolensis]|uniref:Putative S-adenosyl-L-methionine-dependent methyltransferase n=1 Tax=Dermatophilus congolensis TaxID=1863 RepID=A0A239VNX9_9MICO|nr:methyltransferase domain-containing protein [Dermatophilus congolensis]SNV23782.1 putative S-adenosyl-L-methionine-dependent methyltransferase [Dermatophilus congolensis]